MPRRDIQTIDALRRWLEEALEGDIVDVFIVGLRPDGSVCEEFTRSKRTGELILEARPALIRAEHEVERAPH